MVYEMYHQLRNISTRWEYIDWQANCTAAITTFVSAQYKAATKPPRQPVSVCRKPSIQIQKNEISNISISDLDLSLLSQNGDQRGTEVQICLSFCTTSTYLLRILFVLFIQHFVFLIFGFVFEFLQNPKLPLLSCSFLLLSPVCVAYAESYKEPSSGCGYLHHLSADGFWRSGQEADQPPPLSVLCPKHANLSILPSRDLISDLGYLIIVGWLIGHTREGRGEREIEQPLSLAFLCAIQPAGGGGIYVSHTRCLLLEPANDEGRADKGRHKSTRTKSSLDRNRRTHTSASSL